MLVDEEEEPARVDRKPDCADSTTYRHALVMLVEGGLELDSQGLVPLRQLQPRPPRPLLLRQPWLRQAAPLGKLGLVCRGHLVGKERLQCRRLAQIPVGFDICFRTLTEAGAQHRILHSLDAAFFQRTQEQPWCAHVQVVQHDVYQDHQLQKNGRKGRGRSEVRGNKSPPPAVLPEFPRWPLTFWRPSSVRSASLMRWGES